MAAGSEAGRPAQAAGLAVRVPGGLAVAVRVPGGLAVGVPGGLAARRTESSSDGNSASTPGLETVSHGAAA
jgi:hypothetical protein